MFTTDLHLSLDPPRSRVERTSAEWWATCSGKIEQLFQIAGRYEAACIVMGGDIGHTHARWEQFFRNRVDEHLLELQRSYAIPILTIVGNHDRPAGPFSERGYRSSVLAHMDIVGVVKVLMEPVCLTDLLTEISGRHGIVPRFVECPFMLYPFSDGMEDTLHLLLADDQAFLDELVLSFEAAHQDGLTTVAVVHAPVVAAGTRVHIPNPFLLEDCRFPPGLDVVLFGDIHVGFSPRIGRYLGGSSGPILYNPGALIRRSRDEGDRRVQVGIVFPRVGRTRPRVQCEYLEAKEDPFVPDTVNVPIMSFRSFNPPSSSADLLSTSVRSSDTQSDSRVEIPADNSGDCQESSISVRRDYIELLREAKEYLMGTIKMTRWPVSAGSGQSGNRDGVDGESGDNGVNETGSKDGGGGGGGRRDGSVGGGSGEMLLEEVEEILDEALDRILEYLKRGRQTSFGLFYVGGENT